MRRSSLVGPVLVSLWCSLAHADAEASPPGPKTEDGEPPVEEVEVEEGPQPDDKSGVVEGALTDAETKEEIIDGQCSVVGRNEKAVTNEDGRFTLKLPPGTYSIRCFYEGYATARLDTVVVTAGQKTKVAVKLAKDEKKNVDEEVVVEVDADRTTAATQFALRKGAANVSDAVSAQDIAKTPDRNAADATRRVVGASVVGGRFVFVRGLGDRYTNSLLNGTPLPSPEPDVQAIPLDIFPIAVLSDVTILKTFTPDMPADFAGGSVRIQTKSFPTQLFATFTFTGGYNTQTTFRHRWTYAGSRQDWLGIDGGARKLPSIVAAEEKIEGTPEAVEPYGEAFNQKPRRIYQRVTGPSYGFTATLGDTKNVFGNPLGWIASVSYARRWWSRSEKQALYNFADVRDRSKLQPTFDFEGTRDTENVSLGGLLGLGYRIGRHHRIQANGLYSGASDDEVLQLEGYEQDDQTLQRVRRARWVQRQLFFAQLVGEHEMPSLGNALLKWNAFVGQARRNEPNNTQSVYQRDAAGLFGAVNDDGYTHFFSKQTETMKGVGFDWSQPIAKSRDPKNEALAPKIKLGGLITTKDRRFDARRFRYQRMRARGIVEATRLDPGEALTEDSIGRFFFLEENTRSTDTYAAHQGVFAGYVMADLPIGPKLRVIGGPRVEWTSFDILTRDDTELGNPELRAGFRTADLLPGVNAIYELVEGMNLRAALSRTIARPQFREAAPFVYQDFFNAALVYGNPDLRRTLITNADLRWEWFPSADEIVAASLFYKSFRDPIETTVVTSGGQSARKFRNVEGATNYGLELEARKRVPRLPAKAGTFTVLANFTWVHSKVKLGADQADEVTNLERPLQGQSPYVVNLALDWASESTETRARVSYNVFGARIDAIGLNGMPDIYEQPRHTIDVSAQQTLAKNVEAKLAVENLLDAPFLFKQGQYTTSYWRVGRTVWLTANVNL